MGGKEPRRRPGPLLVDNGPAISGTDRCVVCCGVRCSRSYGLLARRGRAVLFEVSLLLFVQPEQVWPFVRQRIMPAGRRGVGVGVGLPRHIYHRRFFLFFFVALL